MQLIVSVYLTRAMLKLGGRARGLFEALIETGAQLIICISGHTLTPDKTLARVHDCIETLRIELSLRKLQSVHFKLK